jgi:predicted nucleic acid-binding protein
MARIIALAENHGLTAYDATYLELADRKGIRLASSDGNPIAAAKAAKIALI